jgi:ribose 5-phosphate isomerase B
LFKILISIFDEKLCDMIAIGSDHAGFELKEEIKEFLKSQSKIVDDKGTFSSESTDYPPYAHSVASSVEEGVANFGILICGSANGVSMAANKHKGIRCAICWNRELAELARLHNDANIIALPARFITTEEALEAVKVFMATKFEGGRHKRRVDLIPC